MEGEKPKSGTKEVKKEEGKGGKKGTPQQLQIPGFKKSSSLDGVQKERQKNVKQVTEAAEKERRERALRALLSPRGA